jgi:hypothetical protein
MSTENGTARAAAAITMMSFLFMGLPPGWPFASYPGDQRGRDQMILLRTRLRTADYQHRSQHFAAASIAFAVPALSRETQQIWLTSIPVSLLCGACASGLPLYASISTTT